MIFFLTKSTHFPFQAGSSNAEIDLIDPLHALVSKSSASDFRRNNDSISSVTTNEDFEDCDDDLESEDFVMNHQPETEKGVEADEDLNASHRIHEALNDEYAMDILKSMIGREVSSVKVSKKFCIATVWKL